MSMINDALRRASNGAGSPPEGGAGPALPPPLLSAAPISPTVGAPPVLLPPAGPSTNSRGLIMVFISLFLFCIVGAAGAYWWSRGQKQSTAEKRVTKPAQATVAPATRTNALDKTRAVVAAVQQRNEDAVSQPQPSATPSPAPAKPAPAAPESAVSAPARQTSSVQFPPLRLQGIYYRANNPSVMINGRTLFVNDQVQGVTVAAIDPGSVTLVLSGRTNVLTLR